MSALSKFSKHDLMILRKVVKRIHRLYLPDLKMENQQADMMIEALAPETIEKYITMGKHLHNKAFLPKKKQKIATDANIAKAKEECTS